MYERESYYEHDPLHGFLRNEILVKASTFVYYDSNQIVSCANITFHSQAYRAIFTSPSSADVEDPSHSRATRRGNAALNDMNRVTPSSIAYVVVQVRTSSFCPLTLVLLTIMCL